MQKNIETPKQINYAELESKARFASFFPKDIKFLLQLVKDLEAGWDVDPKSGFSESTMMKDRLLLKLQAYLDLFGGQDPEDMDPSMIKLHMPESYLDKYREQINKLMPKSY